MAANKKQAYKWSKVKPGDIISFRYASKKLGRNLVNTILVLNPRLPVGRKDGSKTFQLIGLKLETSNRPELRVNNRLKKVLSKIGEFEIVSDENNLYRFNINESFIVTPIKGIKPQAYKLISQSSQIKDAYRTYDWRKARKSSVFLEPIRVFTDMEESD